MEVIITLLGHTKSVLVFNLLIRLEPSDFSAISAVTDEQL